MRRIALFVSLLIALVGCEGLSREFNHGEVSVAYLRGAVRGSTVLITDDIYLNGVVVANDKYGELSKAIVVMDDSGGVAIEIDMDDIEARIPLFSSVRVRCSGLWLGNVGAKMVLGAEPTGDYVVDRLPKERVADYIVRVTHDDKTPAPRRRTIAELEYSDVMSMVTIDNLMPITEECGLWWTDIDTLSGRSVTTVRHLTDGVDTLRVVTESNCQYAKEYIPVKPMRISGVVDWVNSDIAFRITNHSLCMPL